MPAEEAHQWHQLRDNEHMSELIVGRGDVSSTDAFDPQPDNESNACESKAATERDSHRARQSQSETVVGKVMPVVVPFECIAERERCEEGAIARQHRCQLLQRTSVPLPVQADQPLHLLE